jgi:hypothetical protein
MDGELSVDNILAPEEVDTLFEVNEDTPPTDNAEGTEGTEGTSEGQEGTKEKSETTEVVDVDALFAEKPESVSSGKENNTEDKEDTPPKEDGTSSHFYSSIAKALKEEGILPDLDDEAYSKVKSPENLRDLIEQKIHDSLDERQKRIDEALTAGVD